MHSEKNETEPPLATEARNLDAVPDQLGPASQQVTEQHVSEERQGALALFQTQNTGKAN